MDDVQRKTLEDLDKFHMRKGDYADWMLSDERTHFAGNQKVRVINWSNLHEVCEKAGLDEKQVTQSYQESIETGDILFVTYEEPNA